MHFINLSIRSIVFLSILFSSFLSIAQEDSTYYHLKIGGAVRFNYLLKSWDESNLDKGGELAYDMIRFDINADYNHLLTSAQVRFYNSDFGGMLIHHAYIGYQFDNETQLLLGIHQNPFGIQTYASNNWFFNIGYYVGLEDDYDLGLKYIVEREKYTFNLAFYKNSELPASNFARYSYDITGTHNEINQLNAKFEYKVLKGTMGVSAQYGQLEEVASHEKGNHQAYAVHLKIPIKKLDIKAQGSYYKIDPHGEIKDIVYMSAYGAEYEVSTEAFVYTLGFKYQIPVNYKILHSIDIYNDFGIIGKINSNHYNSLMNVLGFGVNMGKLYTYFDYALGKNHAWLGPNWATAFRTGTEDASWHARFNINFGYYF